MTDNTDGETPRRSLRVSDKLWNAYGEACASFGKTRSSDLVQYIEAKVHGHEQRKARELDNEGSTTA